MDAPLAPSTKKETEEQLPSSDASSINISGHIDSHFRLPPSTKRNDTSGSISNTTHSIIDLSPPTPSSGSFPGLTLKSLQTSLIICGQVSGAIHITGVENSVIVVTSRQFRMHASKNVDVYLHCASRPIIEDCEAIRFAPIPESYVRITIRLSLATFLQGNLTSTDHT